MSAGIVNHDIPLLLVPGATTVNVRIRGLPARSRLAHARTGHPSGRNHGLRTSGRLSFENVTVFWSIKYGSTVQRTWFVEVERELRVGEPILATGLH